MQITDDAYNLVNSCIDLKKMFDSFLARDFGEEQQGLQTPVSPYEGFEFIVGLVAFYQLGLG